MTSVIKVFFAINYDPVQSLKPNADFLVRKISHMLEKREQSKEYTTGFLF